VGQLQIQIKEVKFGNLLTPYILWWIKSLDTAMQQ